MERFKKLAIFPHVFYSVLFISYFIYFLLFNRYHLAYQEQIQLFRFDWNYFTGFLTKPGGLSIYSGAFFTQFFINPLAAAFIVTSAGIAIFLLSDYIFKRHNFYGILWPVIPVLLLVALQSDYLYNFGYTIGFILSLAAIVIYISIRKDYVRYIAGIISWFFLYFVSGGFSILALAVYVIHELFYVKGRYRFFVTLVYLLLAIGFPYFAWHYLFYIPVTDAWFYPILFQYKGVTKILLLILLGYFPLLLIMTKVWLILSKKPRILFAWNWKTSSIGTVIFLTLLWGIKRYSYDIKTELLLGIDNSVQNSNWDKALKLSSQYPGTNQIILYLTNLALYKTGHLGNNLFHYDQLGASYLWLEWRKSDLAVLFGGEIFYHLGYINEAYRWAFDAMIAKGQSPRLLKKLIMTSLINGNTRVAEKYLNILNETLFYHKWARKYLNYLDDPGSLLQDKEILEKRHFLIQNDFTAVNNLDFVLKQLLINHPDNRMAFEYYMTALLLDKKITTFAASISHIKDFGYKEIPVNYEEALLVYMDFANTNIVPEGYLIRESTIQRFNDYKDAYASYSGDANTAARNLSKRFGETYWFYLHFINTQVKIR